MRLRDDFDPNSLDPLFQKLKREWDPYNLPANRPGIPNPHEVGERAAGLAAALWPRVRRRVPGLNTRFMEGAAWCLAAMGLGLDDLEEAQWILELGARHVGSGVSFLEVREAVRTLGSQADIFLQSWTSGIHHEATGAQDISLALWEHLAFMTLTPEGADKARKGRGLPSPPPGLLAMEEREKALRAEDLTEPRDQDGDDSRRRPRSWPR